MRPTCCRDRLGTLGLEDAELLSHIAWDIGAEKVARRLSQLIDAPLVLQRYSRLAYDCNRPPDMPSAMPDISEVTPIPGNRNLTPDQRLARTREIYRPFHEGLADLLDLRAAEKMTSIVVSIHSFTPVYKGKPREVELGILHDRDTRLSSKLIKSFPNVEARLNEPYGPKDGVMHTLNLHAAPRGLQHAMIEIRNDLHRHRSRAGRMGSAPVGSAHSSRNKIGDKTMATGMLTLERTEEGSCRRTRSTRSSRHWSTCRAG